MAAELNKTRIRDSRILALVCLGLYFFTKPIAAAGTGLRITTDLFGYIFVVVCAIGRIYTTAFLGGRKNVDLITQGPFSRVRNPLYVFSFIGVVGVSLLTARIGIILLAPIGTLIIYHYLMLREEAFLKGHFGQPYEDYFNRVPRFIPNFSLKEAPETISTSPRRLYEAVRDSAWWFVLIPIFVFLEMSGR